MFMTGRCFLFDSVSSFFLELFLHSSPVVYWHLLTWEVHISASYLAFSYCSWCSQGRSTEVVCHSLLQWHHELSTMTHPPWVALHGLAYSFIELDKTLIHMISLVSFL